MTDLSGKTHVQSHHDYLTGDILLWMVVSTDSQSAPDIAASMGALADENDLGTWSVALIGLGRDRVYFDLTLTRDIDRLMLKLMFGSTPDLY